jgi:hypothetical protein
MPIRAPAPSIAGSKGYGQAQHARLRRRNRFEREICRLLALGKGGYRNRFPYEIVAIFERHGFIWGGKWGHFDTMHFEYRPELLIE